MAHEHHEEVAYRGNTTERRVVVGEWAAEQGLLLAERASQLAIWVSRLCPAANNDAANSDTLWSARQHKHEQAKQDSIEIRALYLRLTVLRHWSPRMCLFSSGRILPLCP